MTKRIIYISLTLSALASLSCNRRHAEEDSLMLDFDFAPEKVEEVAPTKAGVFVNTAKLNTNGNTIGLFGSYYFDGGSTLKVFDAEPEQLVYDNSLTGVTKWTYSPKKKWQREAHYVFKAYYPMTNIVTSTSSAKMLVAEYRTTVDQYDFLVASATRHPASDPEGVNKVQLTFRHALAGIRFKVKYKNTVTPVTSTDEITRLHVDNIYPVGTLMFGQETAADPIDKLQWRMSYFSTEDKYYLWEGSKTFGVDGQPGSEVNVYDDKNDEGVVFVIPQELTTAEVHFSTHNGGTADYSARLSNATLSEWEAGKIYTYTLLVAGSTVDIVVSIEDWNKVASNVDIYI